MRKDQLAIEMGYGSVGTVVRIRWTGYGSVGTVSHPGSADDGVLLLDGAVRGAGSRRGGLALPLRARQTEEEHRDQDCLSRVGLRYRGTGYWILGIAGYRHPGC